MSRVDHFVILDHVQFKKRYFENRNRIRLADKPIWITAPVISKGRYAQKIADVKLHCDGVWQHRLTERIRHAYGKTSHFRVYFPEIRKLIEGHGQEILLTLNMAMIRFFRKQFKIHTPMIYASRMGVEGISGSELILEICRKAGARQYLCGPSGKDYLQLDHFSAEGIEVRWQNFKHPVYPQNGPGFISHLSALDYLFNCGPASFPISLFE